VATSITHRVGKLPLLLAVVIMMFGDDIMMAASASASASVNLKSQIGSMAK